MRALHFFFFFFWLIIVYYFIIYCVEFGLVWLNNMIILHDHGVSCGFSIIDGLDIHHCFCISHLSTQYDEKKKKKREG